MTCGAPDCWSKYTTCDCPESKPMFPIFLSLGSTYQYNCSSSLHQYCFGFILCPLVKWTLFLNPALPSAPPPPPTPLPEITFFIRHSKLWCRVGGRVERGASHLLSCSYPQSQGNSKLKGNCKDRGSA